MTKNNPYYIKTEIKKPVETVYELKGNEYKVPSFEEFMKDYQADEKINYADLGHSDIGGGKGCGPCLDNPFCSRCSTAELERQVAQLKLQRELEETRRRNNRSFRIVITHAYHGFFSHISQLVSSRTWDGVNWRRVQEFNIENVGSARNVVNRLRLGINNPVSMTGLFGVYPSNAPSDALYVVNRWGNIDDDSQVEARDAIHKIENAISSYESGNNIDVEVSFNIG